MSLRELFMRTEDLCKRVDGEIANTAALGRRFDEKIDIHITQLEAMLASAREMKSGFAAEIEAKQLALSAIIQGDAGTAESAEYTGQDEDERAFT